MLVKITRNTVADGKSVYIDDEVEVSEKTGRDLILMRKAIAVGGEVKAPGKAKKNDSTPPKKPAKADEGKTLEDELEKDPDLTGGNEDEKPALSTLAYERLCEMAEDYKIENPNKIKKAILIGMIEEKQREQKAA
jgi:hypothetical protein